jgi:hypothetical protein
MANTAPQTIEHASSRSQYRAIVWVASMRDEMPIILARKVIACPQLSARNKTQPTIATSNA